MDIFSSAFLIVSGLKAKENVEELIENVKEGTRNDATVPSDEYLARMNELDGGATDARWDALIKAGYTAEDIARM